MEKILRKHFYEAQTFADTSETYLDEVFFPRFQIAIYLAVKQFYIPLKSPQHSEF